MSRTLIVLNETDIQRLVNNEHVTCPLKNAHSGEKAGMIVIVSDKCYEAFNVGEYDVEAVENARQYLN